ncbi:MAG: class I mannose-6-phosphate isomerase [Bacteroidales bacterium]|nr:class I mannose-6-phosphate isomerase [Bacteroidales bacterium]
METKKQLYPLKFIPIPARKPWGGDALIKMLGKSFVETDDEGEEHKLTAKDKVGESWELADLGFQESVVEDGWLAGNTLEELMETYIDRVAGEDVYNWYGLQFPLMVKFLDMEDMTSVQVHPDDEIAGERYDALGGAELWYVMDAKPGAKVYLGFCREVTAQEFYERCLNGTVEEILNVIYPKKGDTIYIAPGTVHAAGCGLLVAQVQEASDMTFRLCDWGREYDPPCARMMHLEEAIDIVNYSAVTQSRWHRGPLWDNPEAGLPVVENLVSSPEFTVNLLRLREPVKASTSKAGSFLVYVCVEGQLSIQVPSQDGKGTDTTVLSKGETVLIPADMPDYLLVPRDKGTVILEATVEKRSDMDGYINPDTEAYLEGEDYEGLESGELLN